MTSKALHQGQWHETSAGIMYAVDDTIQFDDDIAHWRDAICRLLEISDGSARLLIEAAVDCAGELFEALPSEITPEKRAAALRLAVRRTFHIPAERTSPPNPVPPSWGVGFDGRAADTVFACSISGNHERMVVGSRESEFAWQVSAADGLPVPAASVTYDRSYYESPTRAHCGMRDYIHHEDWRMEKARRLMKTVVNADSQLNKRWLSAPANVRALDVGSATGYYRKAMGELGFQHHGIDLSRDAIALCRENLGFETWEGSLFDLPRFVDPQGLRFEMITMWDTIEHLDDPLSAVKLLASYLSPAGVLVVRTPSLTAFEADILGDMYYSFKLDHIRYFSPKSLTALAGLAGLTRIYLETTSHIFKGLLGADYLFKMGREEKGADIVALYGHD